MLLILFHIASFYNHLVLTHLYNKVRHTFSNIRRFLTQISTTKKITTFIIKYLFYLHNTVSQSLFLLTLFCFQTICTIIIDWIIWDPLGNTPNNMQICARRSRGKSAGHNRAKNAWPLITKTYSHSDSWISGTTYSHTHSLMAFFYPFHLRTYLIKMAYNKNTNCIFSEKSTIFVLSLHYDQPLAG